MTSDSDCVLGTPKSVIRAMEARGYLTKIELAMICDRSLDEFDRTTVWHFQQYCEADAKHRPDLAKDSFQQALRQAEAFLLEQNQ
jgi:hypothetical protein